MNGYTTSSCLCNLHHPIESSKLPFNWIHFLDSQIFLDALCICAAWPAALLCQTAATLSSYFLLYTIQTKQQQSIQYLKVQIIKMLLNNNPGGRERSYTSIPNALEKIIHYQVFK